MQKYQSSFSFVSWRRGSFFISLQRRKDAFFLPSFFPALRDLRFASTFFIFHFSLFISYLHPFYLSVTELNYNQQNKKMEISVKIFTDDFEKTLHNIHKIPVDLIHPKDNNTAEKQIEDYILSQLKIQCDGKLLDLHFIGYEQEEGAIWSYFESNEINAPKNISITNTLLYKYFESQINIMHVKIGSEKKSYKLDNPESVANFVIP
jgi:hypothetical protein